MTKYLEGTNDRGLAKTACVLEQSQVSEMNRKVPSVTLLGTGCDPAVTGLTESPIPNS